MPLCNFTVQGTPEWVNNLETFTDYNETSIPHPTSMWLDTQRGWAKVVCTKPSACVSSPPHSAPQILNMELLSLQVTTEHLKWVQN